MRTFTVVTLLALTIANGLSAQAEPPIAITHAVIIDGNGGAPIEDGTIVIQGRTIVAVGPSASVTPPAGARVIDGRGKSVMPGIADMHVHLTGGWDGVSVDLLSYRRYLNALLYAGVTTVQDVGNVQPYVLQLRQEQAAGRLPGPRIYAAGALIDGADPYWPPISYAVASVDQIPALVKRQKRDGVDVMKAYHGLSLQMITALAAEGKKESLRVIMDNRQVPMDQVVNAGISAFAHTPIGISDNAIQVMKEKQIFVVTTLAVMELSRRLLDLKFLDVPIVKDAWPPFFLEDLRALATKRGAPTAAQRDRTAAALRDAKRLADAGVVLVGGTDAPYPAVFQGEGIHHEMELYVEAGLTPLQAISNCTRNAAIYMGADQWGTLAQGKAADVLMVTGRPDRNIGDTKNVELVIQGGKILDRASLKFDPRTDTGFKMGASAQ